MNENQMLIPAVTWQTTQRGDNATEYQIYKAAAEDLGWSVKSYEDWFKS